MRACVRACLCVRVCSVTFENGKSIIRTCDILTLDDVGHCFVTIGRRKVIISGRLIISSTSNVELSSVLVSA